MSIYRLCKCMYIYINIGQIESSISSNAMSSQVWSNRFNSHYKYIKAIYVQKCLYNIIYILFINSECFKDVYVQTVESSKNYKMYTTNSEL